MLLPSLVVKDPSALSWGTVTCSATALPLHVPTLIGKTKNCQDTPSKQSKRGFILV